MPAGTVSRRYVPGFVVTIAAAVAGFLVARGSTLADPKRETTAANSGGAVNEGGGASDGRRLAGVNDVPPGGGLILTDSAIVLTRDATGGVAAFSAVCTHQGCAVASVEGGTINCPCHGSKFDARTGQPVDGPAQRPLPAVPVTVRGADIFTT